MILLIDNYDSFTYNIVQYLGELGVARSQMIVFRNDRITCDEIAAMSLASIIISPGPCTPAEAGISVPLVQRFASQVPILGICLGHQSIVAAFGGEIVRAPAVVHGKVSRIIHQGDALFAGIPTSFSATRYHSLIAREESFPDSLRITARTPDGLIMACRHRTHQVHGVQFHPESIMTSAGQTLLANFLVLEAVPDVDSSLSGARVTEQRRAAR